VSVLRRYGIRKTVRASIHALRREAAWQVPIGERIWLSRAGFKPISYVAYGFGSKPKSARRDYISDRAIAYLRGINSSVKEPLHNKLVFHRMLAQVDTRIAPPELVGVLRNGRIVDAHPPYSVVDEDALYRKCRDFYIKPVGGCRGKGVQRVIAPQRIAKTTADMVIVRTVEQAEYSARVFPHSANTVRLVAMRSPITRGIFVAAAVHRFGARGTEPVDNWSRGGLSCPIDIETGVLGPGLRHPSLTDGQMVAYSAHPDTGTVIEGLAVPRWTELISGVHELMEVFPDVEFVAWDLLAKTDGWTVIEGNAAMDIDLLQIHGGLLRDPRVRDFLNHHCPAAL
jgi:hypothetical protein